MFGDFSHSGLCVGQKVIIMAKFLAGRTTDDCHVNPENSEFHSYMGKGIVVAYQSEQVLPLYKVQLQFESTPLI